MTPNGTSSDTGWSTFAIVASAPRSGAMPCGNDHSMGAADRSLSITMPWATAVTAAEAARPQSTSRPTMGSFQRPSSRRVQETIHRGATRRA